MTFFRNNTLYTPKLVEEGGVAEMSTAILPHLKIRGKETEVLCVCITLNLFLSWGQCWCRITGMYVEKLHSAC